MVSSVRLHDSMSVDFDDQDFQILKNVMRVSTVSDEPEGGVSAIGSAVSI